MVQEVPDVSPNDLKEEKGKISAQFQTTMRYGIQIVTDIEDSGTRDMKFLGHRLAREDKRRVLQVDVQNVGERRLRPPARVELYDQKGKEAGRFTSAKLRIYPGCSVRYKFDLSKVPKGAYKAFVIVDNEDDSVFGTQYDLDLR